MIFLFQSRHNELVLVLLQGCDASILLDGTASFLSEKNAAPDATPLGASMSLTTSKLLLKIHALVLFPVLTYSPLLLKLLFQQQWSRMRLAPILESDCKAC